jgi:4-amino-4-deoxy-L-arabinose transferase-like glycosyltransferase
MRGMSVREMLRRAAPGLIMFAAAFILRAVYAWLAVGPYAEPYSDAITYHDVACNLMRTGHFALGDPPRPTAFIPPVMPFLTSLLYRVIGPNYFGGILLQCAIGSFVPLAVVPLGTALYDAKAGRIAGWLTVAHPILVSFSGYLLTESSFTLAITIAIGASIAWALAPGWKRALAAGALWGLATLTRPTVLTFPVVIVAWGWIALRHRVPFLSYARQAVLIGIGMAVVIAPWTVRNAVVMKVFLPVTSGAGIALFDSNNPEKWNDKVKSGGAMMVIGMEPYASRVRGLSEIESDKVTRQMAIEFLRAHVREWPAMAVAKLGRFWRLSNEGKIWAQPGSPILKLVRRVDPLLIWSIVILPLALWGLTLSIRGERAWIRALLPIVILYFTALSAVFWGGLRPRVPIEPLVAILAAVGLRDLWARRGGVARYR